MRKCILLVLVGLFFQTCTNNKNLSGKTASNEIAQQKGARRAEVLFLGHNSKHHDSGKYAPWLAIKLFKSGINLTYTNTVSDLNPENLSKYDALIIYANHDSLSSSQESALKNFVEGGKGLIPLHSAAGCFKNSDWYIKTIGGQFKSHEVGTFPATIVNASHPIMKGITDFKTWDETYVHKNTNPDRKILTERVENGVHEAYTWVRNQGKGRVFYTAYGHNDSTWTNKGYLDLVRNGVLWALGDDVKKRISQLNIPDVDIYNSDSIANYAVRHNVPKIQEALSPEQSQKLTQVAVDFDVKLFASEPDIINPIAMAWDEKGRLWIVESVDYPNTFKETDGVANDRIKICEDTDGDGKADKFTVFADDLNIPTSMVFANGGVIVSMAPHFVFLKDTNGDDKADVREIIMSGWGKNDTHAGPSNLQYGFDNKIWGVLGFSGFNAVVDGKKQNFGQGVYRFSPNGKNLEYLSSTSNNTWGLGFSEDNNVFISTANNTHSAYYSMPAKLTQRTFQGGIQPVQKIDGHYDVHVMTPNLRQVDVVGGFTAAAGHHLYTARNFPKEYWNRIALVTEPTVRLIHNAIIEPDGAGFKEKDGWNLMASSDEWFGPVHAEVGPDGAVWVADWYNFIIQHNVFVPAQAPSGTILPPNTNQPHGKGNAFSSPLRDTNHGRIYRVVYKNAKKEANLKLSKDDIPGLLAALENDNMFWRMTAQRLLVESKNTSVAPALYAIINKTNVDEIGLNSPAVHALWTLHGLNLLNGSNPEALQVVFKAMSHPAAGVRKAAIEVLPKNQQVFDNMLKSGALFDKNLNVRKSVLLAMAEASASESLGEVLYNASKDEKNAKDEWLSKALFAAAITHEDGFIKAFNKNSNPEIQESAFTKSIVEAINKEVYTLGRRNVMQYSPNVTGKEIIIKANLAKPNNNRELQGMILAQGDKSNGYALFIQDGKIKLVFNKDGKSIQTESTEALPEKFELVAEISANEGVTIKIDGKPVANSKGVILFEKPLATALRTGFDFEDETKIGTYQGAFNLSGNLQNITLELKKPKVAEANHEHHHSNASNEKTEVKAVSTASTIDLKIEKELMQFDQKLIQVKAGQKITINIENPDGMQHNFVIIKPGTLNKVGTAADMLARDPKGAEKNYVPKMPEVLFATKLINTDETVTLEFTAPTQAGDYIFVCTFPGHWRGMNGILRIVK